MQNTAVHISIALAGFSSPLLHVVSTAESPLFVDARVRADGPADISGIMTAATLHSQYQKADSHDHGERYCYITDIEQKLASRGDSFEQAFIHSGLR